MNITYRANYEKYQEQISNMNMFLPVSQKLINLLEVLEKFQLYKPGHFGPKSDVYLYR